ncbi:MAG: ribonuclease P protein subunit [Candidatus Parvarchaeota archaeon]|nr:ribonuclease P protein subunit [Candidatus Parvarchaeota archaeon]
MLIGDDVYIKDTGIKGRVVDETKNTLLMNVGGKLVRAMKKGKRFVIYSKYGKEVRVRGDEINMRPWEYAI